MSRSSAGPVAGVTDHYARAVLVTLDADGGAPVLVDRREVALIDGGLPIAPYHHEALEMDLEEAEALVARVRRSVEACASAAVAALVETTGARVLMVPASPHDALPSSLAEVLASRPLTNAADGMLYREALAEAGRAAGLDVRRVPRKEDPAALAAQALEVELTHVTAHVAELGRAAGPPWRKDHKLAAAAALWALAPSLSR